MEAKSNLAASVPPVSALEYQDLVDHNLLLQDLGGEIVFHHFCSQQVLTITDAPPIPERNPTRMSWAPQDLNDPSRSKQKLLSPPDNEHVGRSKSLSARPTSKNKNLHRGSEQNVVLPIPSVWLEFPRNASNRNQAFESNSFGTFNTKDMSLVDGSEQDNHRNSIQYIPTGDRNTRKSVDATNVRETVHLSRRESRRMEVDGHVEHMSKMFKNLTKECEIISHENVKLQLRLIKEQERVKQKDWEMHTMAIEKEFKNEAESLAESDSEIDVADLQKKVGCAMEKIGSLERQVESMTEFDEKRIQEIQSLQKELDTTKEELHTTKEEFAIRSRERKNLIDTLVKTCNEGVDKDKALIEKDKTIEKLQDSMVPFWKKALIKTKESIAELFTEEPAPEKPLTAINISAPIAGDPFSKKIQRSRSTKGKVFVKKRR